VLDLKRHHVEKARDLYADLWLGFTEVEMAGYLRQSGFQRVETAVVHREEQAPHFETLLAVGLKASPIE
jgi:ArsR family transcriptional regulator